MHAIDDLDVLLVYRQFGLIAQDKNGVDEMSEARILGESLMETGIDLLDHSETLKESEDVVEQDVIQAASGASGIGLDKLLPSEHARKMRGAKAQAVGCGRIASFHPVAKRGSQVHERIADGAHFPVEQSEHASWVLLIENQVVELEVVVDETRWR